MSPRYAEVVRETLETRVRVVLNLDGQGKAEVRTGIGFLDHMLASLARHARFDLDLECDGDLEVDDHHTSEDCALALGSALCEALGDKAGIARFGWSMVPMDEALARAAVDLSGRGFSAVDLGLKRDRVGGLASENAVHFFRSLASAAKAAIHVSVLYGDNDHHRLEAAFKALALALRSAVSLDPGAGVPSTKGVI